MHLGESSNDHSSNPLGAGETGANALRPGPKANAGDAPHISFSAPVVRDLVPLSRTPEPVARPVESASFLRSSKMLVLASAAAGLLILGTYLAHRRASAEIVVPKVIPVEHLDLTEVNALPDPFPAVAQAALTGKFQAPAWFQNLEQNSGGDLDYPVREATEEVQPTLRWPAFGEIYHVAVMGPDHQVVAKAELFGDTQWTVPVELQRGSFYMWEVAAVGHARRSGFRVLEDAEAGMVEGLRINHAQSHLVLGVASLQLGLRAGAQREFGALVQEKPHSPEAAELLRVANGLR